jgi:hypothetical protein
LWRQEKELVDLTKDEVQVGSGARERERERRGEKERQKALVDLNKDEVQVGSGAGTGAERGGEGQTGWRAARKGE